MSSRLISTMSTPTVSAAGQIRRGELTEAASSRSRTTKSEKQKALAPSKVLETIEQHVLLDGFKVVIDLDKSRGAYLHNAVSGKRLIDLYGFFGSMPSGFSHPYFGDPGAQGDPIRAAEVPISTLRL